MVSENRAALLFSAFNHNNRPKPPNMNGEITREQIVVMLYRYAKLKGIDVSATADLSEYRDASSVSDWAKEAMQWAVSTGLTNGVGNSTLAPGGNATRAQAAALIMRFMENIMK